MSLQRPCNRAFQAIGRHSVLVTCKRFPREDFAVQKVEKHQRAKPCSAMGLRTRLGTLVSIPKQEGQAQSAKYSCL